jgi:hypothetical protein
MKDADLYSIRFDTSTLDHDPSEPE